MTKTPTEPYDLCIVGAGMIGSAAARHASHAPDVRVCLIGPEEPQNPNEATIFGAYYDEGRITRRTDRNPFWAYAAQDSIRRYREIEQKSGITFFKECGTISVGLKGQDALNDVKESCANLEDCVVLTTTEARARFPYIHFDQNHEVIHESKSAGYINPRAMVQAQKRVARQQGCEVIDDIVNSITESSNALDQAMTLICHSGRVVVTKKVLLATGAFTQFRRLLPDGLSPDVYVVTQSFLLAEVPDSLEQSLREMPSVLHRSPNTEEGRGIRSSFFTSYSTPPIKYPDGKCYLKIGHGPQFERNLTTEESVAKWFRSRPPKSDQDTLWALYKDLYPNVKPVSAQFGTCVTTSTLGRQPFIDLLTPRFGVVLGGNGYAAKSSDELGRIAVELVLNNIWDCPFSRDRMRIRYKQQGKL